MAIKKHWSYEPEKFVNIKNVHEKLLIRKIVEKYAPISNLNTREIFSNNNIPGWVKRVDEKSQSYQDSVVKAIAGMIKLWDNLRKVEKQNYVVNG